MLRVLIADDSETSRRFLVEILSRDSEIQVIGEAKDGADAVSLTEKLRPNLVVMDSHMPQMDGFEATKEIMIAMPTPIVIVTASSVNGDVRTAMQALRAGALTVLQKPSGPSLSTFEETARQLVSTIKAMAEVKVVRHHRTVPPREQATLRMVARGAPTPARVVAIAASTGGPAALQRVLAGLPEDFCVPILVVQHISQGFTRGFVTWLNTVCPFEVKVADDGELLGPRTVYLPPEDRHIGVTERGRVKLSQDRPIDGFRPSATFLFSSVAKAFRSSAVAVILTGMGQDGLAGLRAVREFEGHIIAQDEESSVIFGMPGAAVAAGLPNVILPLESIASRLAELIY
jgi:two-component system chemotaxis response regulator CheB